MAFTGVAVYDIFGETKESISSIISILSPIHTPFLDYVGDGQNVITNKVYTWEEKSMLPATYVVSSAIASSAAASGGIEIGANAGLLRTGDILKNRVTSELMFISSIATAAQTIYATRAYAGTSANSSAAGATLEFIGSAVGEGSSARHGRRVARAFKQNFVQTFREDIIISNLAQNIINRVPGQPDAFSQEEVDKAREVLRQLENSVLMGRTNGNTIGASDVETTLAGIYNSIATNVTSNATYTNSIVNDVFAKVDTQVNGMDTSQYFLATGRTLWQRISNAQTSNIQKTVNETKVGIAPATIFGSDFGAVPVVPVRSLPAGSGLLLRKDFIQIKPFANNSFKTKRYIDGDSAEKGYIEGTYGLEFMQEAAHGRLDGIN